MSTSANQTARQDAKVENRAIDPAHSVAESSVKHMMISTVKGQFSDLQGTIRFDEGNLEASYMEATIDTASVTTFSEQRDQR